MVPINAARRPTSQLTCAVLECPGMGRMRNLP